MSRYNENIWILITRKLSGELDTRGEYEFQAWLESDPKNEEFFRSIEQSWANDPEPSSEAFFFNYESGFDKLHQKIENQKSNEKQNARFIKSKSNITSKGWLIAAVLLIGIGLSVGFYIQGYYQEGVDVRQSYTTSNVEQRIITLADGSVIRMNNNSRIELNDEVDQSRGVYLEGEAFFDIISDPDHPFIIHTKEAQIEVLGTSFNVKEGDELMVAVQEGIVALKNHQLNENSAAKLVAGQLGMLSSNGNDVKIETTDIENYFGWMNGHLSFNGMPFQQVINQLERIYGEPQKMDDPGMGSVRLTVYTENMQMEDVFESISQALNFDYSKEEGVIIWRRGN